MIKIKQKSDSGIFTSPTSDVDWGGHRIFNLGDPIDLKDAVNEQYLAKAVSAIGSRYYMLNTDSGIGSYKLCSSTPSTGDEQSLSVTDLTDGQEIGGWIAPNAGEPPKLIVGVYNWRIYAEKTAGTQTLRLYWKLIERKSDTSEVEIATSIVSNEIVTGKNSYIIPLTLNADYEVAPDSYVACKVFAEVSGGGSAPAVSLYFEGNSASHFQIPANTEVLDSHYAHIDLGNVSDSSVLDKIKNVDGEGSGLDADTVRTFPASQSPQANTIVVSNSDGKIDSAWLPNVGSPAGVTVTTIPAGQSYYLDNNFLQIISAEDNDCKVILPDATTQTAGKLTYIIRCNGNYKIFLYNKEESAIVSVLYPNKVYLITPKNTTTSAGYWESAELDAASFAAIVGKFKYIFENATTDYISTTTLSNDNVLIAYRDVGNSDYGTFCIYDKNGNQVVAPTVFNSANTIYISTTTLSNDNVLIAYRDVGNSNYGTFCIYNENGNQVVAPTVFNSAATAVISATTLSNDNALIAYQDVGTSNYGTFRFIYKGQR